MADVEADAGLPVFTRDELLRNALLNALSNWLGVPTLWLCFRYRRWLLFWALVTSMTFSTLYHLSQDLAHTLADDGRPYYDDPRAFALTYEEWMASDVYAAFIATLAIVVTWLDTPLRSVQMFLLGFVPALRFLLQARYGFSYGVDLALTGLMLAVFVYERSRTGLREWDSLYNLVVFLVIFSVAMGVHYIGNHVDRYSEWLTHGVWHALVFLGSYTILRYVEDGRRRAARRKKFGTIN